MCFSLFFVAVQSQLALCFRCTKTSFPIEMKYSCNESWWADALQAPEALELGVMIEPGSIVGNAFSASNIWVRISFAREFWTVDSIFAEKTSEIWWFSMQKLWISIHRPIVPALWIKIHVRRLWSTNIYTFFSFPYFTHPDHMCAMCDATDSKECVNNYAKNPFTHRSSFNRLSF